MPKDHKTKPGRRGTKADTPTKTRTARLALRSQATGIEEFEAFDQDLPLTNFEQLNLNLTHPKGVPLEVPSDEALVEQASKYSKEINQLRVTIPAVTRHESELTAEQVDDQSDKDIMDMDYDQLKIGEEDEDDDEEDQDCTRIEVALPSTIPEECYSDLGTMFNVFVGQVTVATGIISTACYVDAPRSRIVGSFTTPNQSIVLQLCVTLYASA